MVRALALATVVGGPRNRPVLIAERSITIKAISISAAQWFPAVMADSINLGTCILARVTVGAFPCRAYCGTTWLSGSQGCSSNSRSMVILIFQ